MTSNRRQFFAASVGVTAAAVLAPILHMIEPAADRPGGLVVDVDVLTKSETFTYRNVPARWDGEFFRVEDVVLEARSTLHVVGCRARVPFLGRLVLVQFPCPEFPMMLIRGNTMTLTNLRMSVS